MLPSGLLLLEMRNCVALAGMASFVSLVIGAHVAFAVKQLVSVGIFSEGSLVDAHLDGHRKDVKQNAAFGFRIVRADLLQPTDSHLTPPLQILGC